MTASDQQTETWKPIPGAGYYQASDRGRIRSVDRTIGGRFYKGVVLQPREDGDGYLVVNITDDSRVRKAGASVARLVLLAHDPDGYKPGLEACHGEGGQKDNRWPENLKWDTRGVNREEALAARSANRPLRTCPRCQRQHRDPGQRCHGCVAEIGEQAALRLAEGMDLEKAAEELDYPSPIGLLRLARKHGDLRMFVVPPGKTVVVAAAYDEPPIGAAPSDAHLFGPPVTQRHRPPLARRLRRVMFRRETSRPDSDAR